MLIDGIEIPNEKILEAAKEIEGRSSFVRWEPRHGDEYFFIDTDGTVIESSWFSYKEDIDRLVIGNVFKTEEEAEKARDKKIAKIRVIDALAEHGEGFVPDWGNGYQSKFLIIYVDGGFYPNSFTYTKNKDNAYYSTKEACQWVIDNMNEDLKLMFEVEV